MTGKSPGRPPVLPSPSRVTHLAPVRPEPSPNPTTGPNPKCGEQKGTLMSARVWLFGAVAAALAATPVRADEPAAKPAPYVLVVGAGEFKDKAIQPRPSADADATALYDLLTDPKHLDVPAGRAVLLLSNPDPKRG